MGKSEDGKEFRIHGDLHIVGNCAVLYMPPDQLFRQKVHGIIRFDVKYFWRRGQNDMALVIPAHKVFMNYAELHPCDLARWKEGRNLDIVA